MWRHQYLFVPVECYLYFLSEGLFWWMGIKFAVLKQGVPSSLILWDTWHKIYSSWATHNNIRCKNKEEWINILVVDQAWILWIIHTLLKGLSKFVSSSHISLLTLLKFKTKNLHLRELSNQELWKLVHCKQYFTYCIHAVTYVLLAFILWVKVSLRNVHTMLKSICEVHEKWHMEGNTFLVVVNEMMFKPVHWNCMTIRK